MTHILHRHLRAKLPRAVGGRGIVIVDGERQGISRRVRRRRRVLPRPRPSRRRWQRCMRRSIDSPTRTRASSPPKSPKSLADHLIAHAPDRHVARLFRVRRLRSDRGVVEARPSVFRRDRRAAAAAFHRAATELPRQHAGRACGRRQRVAAASVCAAADRRDARLAVLRIPRPAARTNRPKPTASGSRASSRTRSDGSGRAT